MDELRECDMVMKGGITSGVVYPSAVADLSDRYRFRNLGGASAGAIAAAAAAAAEFNRDGGGFDRLRQLPDSLGRDLAKLFQPDAELASLFEIALEASATKKKPIGRIVRAASPSLRIWYGLLFLLLVGAVVLFFVAGVWAGLFGITVVLLGAVGVAIKVGLDLVGLAKRTINRIDENNFGICDGHTPTPGYDADPKPITEWLYDLFNDLAGVNPNEPLTFGHLWGDDAVNLYREALAKDAHNPPDRSVITARKIDLLVMATNVSMARPYKMPFDNRSYMFCDTCLSSYFNDTVRAHMQTCPSGGPASEDAVCPTHNTRLWDLPAAPDLPLIVAVRISLSFPLLFSAVPLHMIDRYRKDGQQTARICWFADGGISSNFPIHFFDAMWPTRPTFGISLGPTHPDYASMAYRPHKPGSGINLRIADINSSVGFLKGILDTMQNWADSLQRTLPGYRDRIVEIRTDDSEGGLNIAMSSSQIARLANRGSDAAGEFSTFDFETHQWIRYRSATSEISKVFDAMYAAWNDPEAKMTRLHDPATVHAHYDPTSEAWLGDDKKATEKLMTTVEDWQELKNPARRSSPPRPSPEIRITPRM